MRRKRLKHAADTLCEMFCGWRLANSFQQLEELGSGRLEIDALIPTSRFNGAEMEPLPIAHELHSWLAADLEAHNIPVASIGEAKLTARLELTRSPAPLRPQHGFYIGKDGKPIRKGEFFQLSIQCKSSIRTEEATYSVEKSHEEQWPVGWPES